MELDIFIEGETIDLRIPTLEFAEKSDWYKWFNDTRVTSFLEHGVFPNTREKQIDFFLTNHDKRIILIICTKQNEAIGTISINNPDFQKSLASVGIVLNPSKNRNPLSALEAMARITEHGFEKMGLNILEVGHHINLIPWSHQLSLLGYRLEGITRKRFKKGLENVDCLIGSATLDDYLEIKKNRGGMLWDNQRNMLNRIRLLPKTPIHKKLQDFFEQHNEDYQRIFAL